MTKETSVISVRALSTGYRLSESARYVVTSPFDAVLPSGCLTCLLGPNGSGKSTLLRTLAGFQKPLSGEVMIDGISVSAISCSRLSTLVSVVLTDRPDSPHLDVRQLVALGRSPYTGWFGRMSESDQAIVNQAMEQVSITALADRTVSSLSDGERQKVMIAKSLAQSTPVIFLDEPTAFLDYPAKVDILMLLRHLAFTQGKTIMLSTHDLELALRIADYTWLIDRKLGITTGLTSQLAADGSIARYFERPGLTFHPSTRTFDIVDER
ncbi:MAG: ABC transporter ATP-binding protein [Duncaniella sp.]|nr:ABC transporter ATP-binding protein [Duncaniella sp.]